MEEPTLEYDAAFSDGLEEGRRRLQPKIEQLQAENKDQADFLSLAKEEMDTLAAKLEEHRWIPVTERLPENNKQVLCYIKNPSSVCSGALDSYRTGFNIGAGSVFYPLNFITHWKLIILPKPKEAEVAQRCCSLNTQRAETEIDDEQNTLD